MYAVKVAPRPHVIASASQDRILARVQDYGELWPPAILLVVAIATFVFSRHAGDFWWSEAPRNALDGAFVHDFVRAFPWSDPIGWAKAYYLQYPALTVLFYPPLLHFALAGVYALFGVSDGAAVGTIVGFFLLLLLSTYSLARHVAGRWAALCAALLLASKPEMLIWSQQVMLDVPALALTATSAIFLIRYGKTGRPRELAFAAALGVAALYTKQTALVDLGALLIGLLLWRGPRLLRRPHACVIAAIAIVALLPLAYLQIRIGSFNFALVAGIPELNGNQPTRFASLVWYLCRLPSMAGWGVLALGACGIVIVLRRPSGPSRVVLAWLIVGYAGLTIIAEKETRHGLSLLPPLAILAAAALEAAVTRTQRFFAARTAFPGEHLPSIAIACSAAAFCWTLSKSPTPVVVGVRAAAEDVVGRMPDGGRVMFEGVKDGAFIFDVRVLDADRKITVVRADKMFLRIDIQPELGLHPLDFSETEIGRMIDSAGISYVVATPSLWTEAAVMRRFQSVLAGPQFERVGVFPMTGPIVDKQLVLYRNTHSLAVHPTSLKLELMGGAVP